MTSSKNHHHPPKKMRFKKILLWSLLIVLILFSVWFYRLIWGKPFNFDHFTERVLIESAWAEPEILTMVGIIDNTFLDFHSHKLTDASPEHYLRQLDWADRNLALLRKYNRDKLKGQKAITYDVVEWFLEDIANGREWMLHNFPVNQTAGVQNNLPSFMTSFHSIRSQKSAENYIQRLQAFEEKFSQVREFVLLQADNGVVPPRFVIEHVLREMRDFIAVSPEQNTLYETFETKLAEVEGISDETREELLAGALSAVGNEVYSGYGLLIETFEGLHGSAREEAGAWTLPNGDAFYDYMILNHTTLPFSADEIHQIGLEEVGRIRDEMFGLFDSIGITEGSIAERFAELDLMPDMFYPDIEESYQQIVDDYAEMVDFLLEKTKPLFRRVPKAGIEVHRVPEYSEATAPFAYYSMPSLDGERPGIFYINLRDINEIPKYGMMTLSAHEGVPGHHFQIALQQEIEDVPTIRRILPFNAYAEGWALYTEWLLSEIGIYDNNPFGDLGRLQAEMFRAVRLVVDTGIHRMRWTREEAIEYMIENTGMPRGDVVSEIERYIVWPGQALGYKLGMMHIQGLRSKVEAELGDAFDVAEFHDVILMNGSMPMGILTGIVQDYIDGKKGG